MAYLVIFLYWAGAVSTYISIAIHEESGGEPMSLTVKTLCLTFWPIAIGLYLAAVVRTIAGK